MFQNSGFRTSTINNSCLNLLQFGVSESTTPFPLAVNTEAAEDDAMRSVMSQETYQQFSDIANDIFTPILCSVGLIANVFSLSVLYRASRMEKLTIHVYLCFLTLLDSTFLFVGLIRSIPKVMNRFDKYLANDIEQHANLGFIYFDMVLTYTTGTLIVVMSVERLLALIRPFSLKDSWLTKYPKIIVALCVCSNAAFLSPFPINFEVASFQNFENQTEYYLRYKKYAAEFMDRYMIAHTVINNYIPATILLCSTTRMLIFFWTFRQRALTLRKHASHGRRQIKISVAVLCITIFYFLFSIPDIFIKTRPYFNADYSFSGKERWSFWMWSDLSNIFSYMSAANDFIIYILVSDHYRRIFMNLHCPCVGQSETVYRVSDEEQNKPETQRSSGKREVAIRRY